MQTRPYEEKDGRRVWLDRVERETLLDAVASDEPRRRIALQLGLHGLRCDELVQTTPAHVEALSGAADGYRLLVPDGKSGRRELPISDDLAERVNYLKGAAKLSQDEPLIDVSKRSVRNWIDDARDALDGEHSEEVGMHDLRRSWATDTYYSLAFSGVPIAEQLVMSWGGWKQTETGRDTFRQNYLGPVPDYVTGSAKEDLALV
jgi:integrase